MALEHERRLHLGGDRWGEIDSLLRSALERKPEERRAYVEQVCGGDDALRRELESLLVWGDAAAARNFLEPETQAASGRPFTALRSSG